MPTDSRLWLHLLAFGFFLLFAHLAWRAVRSGFVKPSNAERAYLRRKEPAGFWFHAISHIIIACAFLMATVSDPRLMTLGFGLLFAHFAVSAIRTGRVKPSIYDRVYTRAGNAGTFWFHVAVEAFLACALIAAAF